MLCSTPTLPFGELDAQRMSNARLITRSPAAGTYDQVFKPIVFGFCENDPEPDVPRDVTPEAQCAFDTLVLRISAVRTNYRVWLRSLSTYEPSDPPARLDIFCFQKKKVKKKGLLAAPNLELINPTLPQRHVEKAIVTPHCRPRTLFNSRSALHRIQQQPFSPVVEAG